MPREHRLFLDDILEAVDRIRDYTKNMNAAAFAGDTKTQDAVVHNLEIIGEAAGKLPEEIRVAAPEIEWRKIVELRNILAHEYFGINLGIVWDVIQTKLEPLGRACRRLANR